MGQKSTIDQIRESYGETKGSKGEWAENGGVILPLAPFGIPKYDNGGRFDLRTYCLYRTVYAYTISRRP